MGYTADARLTTLTAIMCEIQSSQHSSSPSCHLLLRCRRSQYPLARAENTCRSALSASLGLWHVELHLEVHVEEVHVELHLEDAEVEEPVEIAEYALAHTVNGKYNRSTAKKRVTVLYKLPT